MGIRIYHGRVVGINFEPAKTNFREKIKKFNQMPIDKVKPVVSLKEEPDNPYDPNAVMVLFGQEGEELVKVGYIPKEQNVEVLRHGLENVEVHLININRMDDKVVGLEIEVVTKGETIH